MSITSIINRNNYTGNDSTAVYSYTFKVFTKNDFEIKVRNISTGVETLLVVDVDYTVSGAGTVSGGSITLIGSGAWIVSSKLTAGYELSIRRLREIKQLADIKNQGSFYPETHEDVFDKLTMVDLQQQDSIDRTVKLPSSINPNSFNTDIPASIVGSVSRAFITNATGDGFDVGPTADEISNAQSYAVGALASQTAAGISETNAAASAASAAGEVATHAALTTTHGVTGDIVGTGGTQTLTNKTLTSPIISQISNTGTLTLPTSTDTLVGRATTDALTNKDIDGGTASNTSRITLPKAAKTTLDALTRKQGTIVFDTTLNKPYYDDGSSLKVIGSGSGGAVNLVSEGDADNAPSSIFVPYADAAGTRPVDGTGGSPTVTTSVSSTTPLIGTKSFLLTKPASNVQGQGWSIPFTVDLAYRAKSLKISVDYILNSGTFVAGSSSVESDVIFYIYDVTNSQLIEPSNIKLFASNTSTSDKYEATFQTSATGSSYLLIAHVQSVSALAYELKVDNVSVSPQNYAYAPIDTEWAAYTPTFVGLGTVVLGEAFWKRVGDSIIIKGRATTGTPTGSVVTISLPAGMVISSTKTTIQAIYGHLVNNSTPGNFDLLAASAGTTVGVGNIGGSSGLVSAVGTTVAGTGQALSWYSQPIPITGWASNTQVSDGYDARSLSFTGSGTGSTQAITAATTNIAATALVDKASCWTGSTYVVKSAGDYWISAFLFSTTAAFTAQVYVNAVANKYLLYTVTNVGGSGSVLIQNLKAGDIISIRSTVSMTLSADANQQISIVKDQAPQTISAIETVAARFKTSTARTINNTSPTIVYETVDDDTHGAYNSTTGEFTVPISGRYNISGYFRVAAVATSINFANILQCFKNGTLTCSVAGFRAQTTGAVTHESSGASYLKLVAGDKLTFRFYADTTNTLLASVPEANYVCVNLIK